MKEKEVKKKDVPSPVMEKYRLKLTKYAERMYEVRLHPRYKEYYIEVTGKN